MIYYFSGTGNSRYVAQRLGASIRQEARFIPATNPYTETLGQEPDSSIGIVFPVYSWGVPPIVLDFLAHLPEAMMEDIRSRNIPLWCVATCGDETGDALTMLRKALRARNVDLSGAWSVIMPNVYVMLPGFGTDSASLEEKKLKESISRVTEIAGRIEKGDFAFDVHTGTFPRLRTSITYPLFRRWGVQTKRWHFTDTCISCGKCARTCPVGNIAMSDGHPVWGTDCTSCCACFHICPTNSIQYGRITRKMGQYSFRNPSEQ
ncbi:MAG: EFR1 family ferrodoxin [Muribaculaceae bacterium]|nr:EFR1 family ferrodoxin [Muribaculaceae bacterium]